MFLRLFKKIQKHKKGTDASASPCLSQHTVSYQRLGGLWWTWQVALVTGLHELSPWVPFLGIAVQNCS